MSDPNESPALFQESLNRVNGSADFLDQFYRRFVSASPEVAAVFQGKDMVRIQRKLKMTLEMVSDSASGQPGLEMYLSMLGKTHVRLKISPEMFHSWRKALLETVARCDPKYSDAIARAWAQVIDDVIDKMQAKN